VTFYYQTCELYATRQGSAGLAKYKLACHAFSLGHLLSFVRQYDEIPTFCNFKVIEIRYFYPIDKTPILPKGCFCKHNFAVTVNSRFKKDLKLQIYLHKAFFSDDQFLDSLHKSFLNQTTLDLRKKKWTFLD